MKAQYQQIYLAMIKAVTGMESSGLPEAVQVKKKYLLCFASWNAVKIHAKHFDTEFDEIDFFRNIKPCFTTQMEYFSMLNEALLFSRVYPLLVWSYWNNELGRYDRFRERHQSFVEYYESGSQEKDRQYFTVGQYKPGKEQPAGTDDEDAAWCTHGDALVSLLHALKLYREYVAARISKWAQDVTSDASSGISD